MRLKDLLRSMGTTREINYWDMVEVEDIQKLCRCLGWYNNARKFQRVYERISRV